MRRLSKDNRHYLMEKVGYEAIREYKIYTDEKDPLLIYSINENEQIVFKTSCS